MCRGLYCSSSGDGRAAGFQEDDVVPIDQLPTAAPDPTIRNWTARDIDTALYWMTTYQHSMNLINTPGT